MTTNDRLPSAGLLLRCRIATGAVTAFLLTACEDWRTDPRELAPARSDHPWESSETLRLGKQLSTEAKGPPGTGPVDTARTYDLPALVDLAESRNASTREAWELARSTAATVGMAKAEYYPMLAVAATTGGGYRTSRIDIDADLAALAKRNDLLGALLGGSTGKTSLDLNSGTSYDTVKSSLDMKWLLFDFGGRRAALDATKRATIAANLSFDATHQELAYKVVRAYVLYQGACNEVEASRVNQDSARGVLKATEAKSERGLATEPELLRVKQVAAEADYSLVTAESNQRTAYVDLAEAVVAPPGAELKILPPPPERLAEGLDKPLDRYITLAMSRRPDLLAKLAVVQAREAELRKARAADMPEISLLGTAGYTGFDGEMHGSGALKEVDTGMQNYGAFLTVQWPLFTGGKADNAVRAAESKHRAAEAELALSRDKAVADIWRGYVKAKNAISSRLVADAMLTASKASLDSALAGYERGVVSNQDLLLARGAHAKALYIRSEADSMTFGALAALALGSGDIEGELIKQFRR